MSKDFETKIKDLDQTEILTGAVSSLNKLLVDKNLATETELKKYFLNWLKTHRRTKCTSAKNKHRVK